MCTSFRGEKLKDLRLFNFNGDKSLTIYYQLEKQFHQISGRKLCGDEFLRQTTDFQVLRCWGFVCVGVSVSTSTVAGGIAQQAPPAAVPLRAVPVCRTGLSQ